MNGFGILGSNLFEMMYMLSKLYKVSPFQYSVIKVHTSLKSLLFMLAPMAFCYQQALKGRKDFWQKIL